MNALKQRISQHRARQRLPRIQQILCALRTLDDARMQIRRAEQNLSRALAPGIEADGMYLSLTELEALRDAWAAFQAEGGTTAQDWERWLAGAPLRRLGQNTTPTTRGHLRIVASNKGQPACAARLTRSLVYRGPPDPPEAA